MGRASELCTVLGYTCSRFRRSSLIQRAAPAMRGLRARLSVIQKPLPPKIYPWHFWTTQRHARPESTRRTRIAPDRNNAEAFSNGSVVVMDSNCIDALHLFVESGLIGGGATERAVFRKRKART